MPDRRPALQTRTSESIVTQIRKEIAVWRDLMHQMGADFLVNHRDVSREEFDSKMANLQKTLSVSLFRSAQHMAKDTLLLSFWEAYREVYEVHPAVTAALNTTRLDTQVPGQLFRELRHINPMFVFPTGLDMTMADGGPGRVIAMALTGARRVPGELGNATMDTHDEHADGLRVMMLTDVLSPDASAVVDLDLATFPVRFTETGTVQEMIDRIVESEFQWDRNMPAPGQEQMRAYLSQLVTIAVEHLIYAISASFEAETTTRGEMPPAAAKAAARQSGRKPPKPARIRRVGFRDGAAIQEVMRRRQDAYRSGAATGRTVAPHMRAAHWHTYWTGKGRETPVVKWLLPTLVNAAGNDGTTVTIHAVKEQTA